MYHNVPLLPRWNRAFILLPFINKFDKHLVVYILSLLKFHHNQMCQWQLNYVLCLCFYTLYCFNVSYSILPVSMQQQYCIILYTWCMFIIPCVHFWPLNNMTVDIFFGKYSKGIFVYISFFHSKEVSKYSFNRKNVFELEFHIVSIWIWGTHIPRCEIFHCYVSFSAYTPLW